MRGIGWKAIQPDDAPAQHRHELQRAVRRARLDELSERIRLRRWNVQKEEARRRALAARFQFAANIAVDQRQRDEKPKAEAERKHDGRNQGPRPVNIADREAQSDAARMRQPPRQRHDHGSEEAQQDESGDGPAKVGERELAVAGESQRRRDEGQRRRQRHQDIARPRPCAERLYARAEDRLSGDVVGAAKRRG